jgi:hypothetical protein
MAAHILQVAYQVAYYDSLREIRAKMLEAAGTSVLGNDKAVGLNKAVIATADLVMVGFSTPHPFGTRWFMVQSANEAMSFFGGEEGDADLSQG